LPRISGSPSAVLLISCPDRKGLVAVISNFIFTHNGNILHADEHRDAETNLFLMRVEFDPSGMDVTLDALADEFIKIAERFEMQWRLAKNKRRPRMGTLVSQYDHCLADLLYRHKAGELDCDIPVVISNHTDAERLAGFYGAKFVHTPVTRETKSAVERQQIALLRQKGEVEIDFQYFLEPYEERLRAAGVAFRASRTLHCAKPMELMSVPHGYPGVVRACVPE